MIRRFMVKLAVMVAVAVPMAGVDAGAHDVRPKVQIAILLDTSNSMDGLIGQAKSELWKVVNEFIGAKVGGARPELQVALYEYGNTRLSRESGFIRQVLDLSDDLDAVSKELFALKTRGGDEYCGWVIDHAVRNLQWTSGKNDLKLIFIAGNEPFTQGKVPYSESCALAARRGIVVNTIFCGPEASGISGKWNDGALLAGGSFMNINQNMTMVHIAAPQDKELAVLSVKLNATYIAYGRHGAKGLANQVAQDRNAESAGSYGSRVAAKASGYYRNSAWDLVDALEDEKVDVSKLKDEDLPEVMRKMSKPERGEYVKKQLEKRHAIQAKIKTLNDARTAHVTAERKKNAVEGEKSLDQAMIKAIRSQAAKKNFEMK